MQALEPDYGLEVRQTKAIQPDPFPEVDIQGTT